MGILHVSNAGCFYFIFIYFYFFFSSERSSSNGKRAGSFAGLGFLSLYLSGKIQVFDRKGHVAKLCVTFLPLLMASLVGISRVDDYWHHWQDVFAGGILGIFYDDTF